MAELTPSEGASSNPSALEHGGPGYITIFVYLTVLTGAELFVYAMGLATVLKVGLLVLLALTKAALVAMYFMHLALERKGLWIVAATPLMLVAFAYFMLRPDLSARAWVSSPAHQTIGHHEGEPTNDDAHAALVAPASARRLL